MTLAVGVVRSVDTGDTLARDHARLTGLLAAVCAQLERDHRRNAANTMVADVRGLALWWDEHTATGARKQILRARRLATIQRSIERAAAERAQRLIHAKG